MFTGIVEETGEIRSIKKGWKSAVLSIRADKILENLKIGDSVSTNGVCLTVTKIIGKEYQADVMNETLTRSTLGALRVGSKVNLERAMRADDRFGGHIVSGHIDGVGKITSITKDDIAVWYQITAADKLMKYIVEKGSIAMDGISLTVAKIEHTSFQVSVIPHTVEITALKGKRSGELVNLETDILAKYIEKLQISNTQNSNQKISNSQISNSQINI